MKKLSMLRLSITALVTICAVLLSGCGEQNSEPADIESTSSALSSDMNSDEVINVDMLHDSDLTGRWRAADGSYIELWANGDADTDLNIYEAYFDDAVSLNITSTWTGGNGQLTFSTDYWATFGYEYFSDNDALYLKGKNNRRSARYQREAGVPGSGLVGDWDIANCYFAFCEDGTGSCKKYITLLSTVEFPISWYTNDENLNVGYGWTSTYDYYLSGDVLTMFYAEGSQDFVKVSEHM